MANTSNNLIPEHAELIKASAIDDEVRDERGYRSITEPEEIRQFGRGLLIPLYDVDGQNGFFQTRLDVPRDKDNRYRTPKGQRNILDVHPRCRKQLGDPKVPLIFTEGSRKADAAVSKGLCAISLTGVCNWRTKNKDGGITVLADFGSIAWNGRIVLIIFDSDAATNPNVDRERKRLREELIRRKAKPWFVNLPPSLDGSKVGLDDWFAKGHTAEELMELAERSEQSSTSEKKGGAKAPGRKPGFRIPLTDYGNARRMVRFSPGEFIYSPGIEWFQWSGAYWRPVEAIKMHDFAKPIGAVVYAEGSSIDDPKEREQYAKWSTKSESANSINAMINLCRTEPEVYMDREKLDTHSMLFNVQNGTIDLSTGRLREHYRGDYITKISPVSYDERMIHNTRESACPVWDRFLLRVMDGNTELIDYLRRVAGLCLTGQETPRALWFLHGGGRNGKSKFVEAISGVLGDYAQHTQIETLMIKRLDTDLTNDLARLRGARFVYTTEVPQGRRLHESRVKDITGGDMLTARPLYKEHFTFKPVFKLLISGNHKPIIAGTDDAIWDRVMLVPFIVRIPEEEVDEKLPDKFRAEYPGILAWMVRGWLELQRDGKLIHPAEVRKATQEYRNEEDVIGQFLADRTERVEAEKTPSSELFEAYVKHSDDRNMTSNRFARCLTDRGFTRGKGTSGVRVWIGIKLIDDGSGEGFRVGKAG